MKIKSNGLVKVLVPAVLIAGVFVVVKGHNSKPSEPAQPSAQSSPALANLTPQELKAIGVEGDTPQDTLRTIVGSLIWTSCAGTSSRTRSTPNLPKRGYRKPKVTCAASPGRRGFLKIS